MTLKQVNRYDRQIRAWGFETQRKLESSKLIFIGLNEVSVECMKNLILAGAGAVHIITKIGENQHNIEILTALNPNTSVIIIDPDSITNLIAKCSEYDIICCFEIEDKIVREIISLEKVILICKGVSAALFHKVPEERKIPTFVDADSLTKTICGSLLSQMLVDHLPPIEGQMALKLEFDPISLSAIIINMLK